MTDEKMMPCPVEITDDVLDDILKKTGEWCVPYIAPRECGVPVDGDISQEDADTINDEMRKGYREFFAIALPALTAWNKRVQPEGGEAIDEERLRSELAEIAGCQKHSQRADRLIEWARKQASRAILSSDRGDGEADLLAKGWDQAKALLEARAMGWKEAVEAAAKIAREMKSGPVYYVDGQPNARTIIGGDLIADEILRSLPSSHTRSGK